MRFDELDLEDEILDGLDDMHFEEMTPVQEHTIPVILEGRDLIGCAQTGTGKTAAYTLPLLNKLLLEGNDDNVIKSVIIVPTRELAQQIDQQFQGFSYYLPVSTTVVYGGGDGKGWDIQKKGMLMGSDVVIATPGRMISHLQNSGVDLSHVEYLILDEADRMLDMGFADDIMKIISYMPRERQTIMFSATLPPKIRELAKSILRNPAEVNIAISKPNEAIDQSAYVCYESQKLGIIRELFAEPTESKTIIFSSSKLKVKELAHEAQRRGHAFRPGAGAARGGDARLQEQQGEHPGGDGHRGPRHRHRGYRAGHQLRRAARSGRLHPPHRPHGARRGDGQCRDLRQRGGTGRFPPDREVHRARHPQGRTPGIGGRGAEIRTRREPGTRSRTRRPQQGR